MRRFVMPESGFSIVEKKKKLIKQFDEYINSDVLSEVFSILKVDRDTFREKYNTRLTSSGRVRESQELEALDSLEKNRLKLYPLFDELGFLRINKPIISDYNRIVILGGAASACFNRTKVAQLNINSDVKCVDGLSAYRPINPVEEMKLKKSISSDTEFGVMSEAFSEFFNLDGYHSDFTGDRNLNSVSCIREFEMKDDNIKYRVFASPSSQPDERRANTADTLYHYLDTDDIGINDKMLFITNNVYCNRQFVQIAYSLMSYNNPASFDIIGCSGDDNIVDENNYGIMYYIQEILGLIDWIERFKKMGT